MFDKREWLADRNLAKRGTRGKFSKAAHEALAAALAEGVVFHDTTRVAAPVAVVGDDGKVKTETRDVNPWAHHPAAIRSGMLTFVGKDRKRHSVNSTEACTTCMHSFGWCYCDKPTFRIWHSGEVLTLV